MKDIRRTINFGTREERNVHRDIIEAAIHRGDARNAMIVLEERESYRVTSVYCIS